MQKLLALLGAKSKGGICCAACTVYQVWPCWRKQHGGIDGGVLYLFVDQPRPVYGRQRSGNNSEHCQCLFLER